MQCWKRAIYTLSVQRPQAHNTNLLRVIIIIIYYDFLPPPSRGGHMSSQITHKHQDTPLSPYTWHLSLDFHWLRPFYSLSQPHHVTASLPLKVITKRARQGGPKRTQCQAKMAELQWQLYCTRALHSFWSFAHCRAASTVIPLLPKATFTPSL